MPDEELDCVLKAGKVVGEGFEQGSDMREPLWFLGTERTRSGKV